MRSTMADVILPSWLGDSWHILPLCTSGILSKGYPSQEGKRGLWKSFEGDGESQNPRPVPQKTRDKDGTPTL
jgi:hypothetical protein